MLQKVKLHGDLADFVGHKQFDVVINKPADAIKFLICNFPKVEAYMATKYYQVLVNDKDIDENELHNPSGQADINIVPVIRGSGGSPIGRILLGAALIGGAFLFSPLTFANFGSTAIGFGSAAGIAKGVAFIGGALILSGASELLFPLPTVEVPEDDPRRSFSFSGLVNTNRAGTPVPVVYGEVMTGSVIISAGIDTDQVSA